MYGILKMILKVSLVLHGNINHINNTNQHSFNPINIKSKELNKNQDGYNSYIIKYSM